MKCPLCKAEMRKSSKEFEIFQCETNDCLPFRYQENELRKIESALAAAEQRGWERGVEMAAKIFDNKGPLSDIPARVIRAMQYAPEAGDA